MKALVSLLLLLCLLSGGSQAAEKTARHPSIVIFLADDSGWGDYSISGNTNLHTPNIDSIARSGASLDRFYVCAVCSPTRAEFLTGRYHSRAGVRGVSTGQERLNTDEKTLADACQAAGYATGAFGKWHNGSQWPYHPNARGFDEYYGFTSGHWGEYFDPPLEHNGQPVRGKGFIADDLTSHAIEFIERQRGKPFLCYIPFNTPHSPWAVPDEYWRRFKDKPLALRATDSGKEKLDQTRCALAMVENLDANVGRVLQRLDELKLREDTIVIYFSDNGPNGSRWNGGMKGVKSSTDEGGVRSVFFIRWPGGGIRPGTTVREISGAIDLLPTLASMTGIQRVGDKPLDGRDLSPLLRGGRVDWAERILFSHWNGSVSARSQQYCYDSQGALFDMLADPGQKKDIAGEKPDLAAQMAKSVAQWRAEVLPKTKDDRPYPVGYPEFPRTPLPARDGIPHGGVKRSASAPNSSYFVNWRSLDDTMTWDIAVNTTGDYDAEILYTCPVADAGSTIGLEFNGATLIGKVMPGWNPPLYTNQDTIPRPAGESRMKEFRALNLGVLRLEKARGLLTLRALDIPGKSVMDVRQVNLTLRSAAAVTPVKPQSAELVPARTLALERTNHWLVIRGPHLPGAIRINYLEAYCRAGSTDADWVKHTVIPHTNELLSFSADAKTLRLRDTLADGVTVEHTITARDDEVEFRLAAHNPGATRSEAHWAQPCVRLSEFMGFPEKTAGNATDYLPRCFIFLDGKPARLPTRDWATQARYVPGQVWCPALVPRADVNPRPLSPLVPDNGLIGAFSADETMIFATAWEPYQELFQGVARCLHSDFRLGGLAPGERREIRGKIYLVPADVPALLNRYEQDFPEHRRKPR